MTEAPTPPSRVALLILAGAILAGTVLGSVGGTALALAGSAPGASEQQLLVSPTVPASPATTADPQAEETTEPQTPTGRPLPESCDALYSSGMRSTMSNAGVTLNPSWIYEPSLYHQVGTTVTDLQSILDTPDKLTCTWTLAAGGSEVGLTTEIMQVTDAQAKRIVDKLTSIGWTRLDELGGVRFVVQRDVEGNTVGESQFLREGVWFSTQYLNLAVNGYTADMVAQVFG
jgi:hypothetical protein